MKYIIIIECCGIKRIDICTEEKLDETLQDYERAGWKIKSFYDENGNECE